MGTTLGRRDRPHLLEAWGSRFNVQLEDHLAIFRYKDQPGMIGRVGTELGEQSVNIASAAVGAEPGGDQAVMVLTTDAPVRPETIEHILQLDGFAEGRAVNL